MSDEDRPPLCLFFPDAETLPEIDADLAADHLAPEADMIDRLLPAATFEEAARNRIRKTACDLITHVRAAQQRQSPLDALLHEYDLSSDEGVILMCLAEALLRIPDAATADRLIHDKLGGTHWDRHLGRGGTLLVNASTWSLMLTGRLVELRPGPDETAGSLLGRLVARAGEPVVRGALRQAMHVLAHQFVMGRTIGEALKRSHEGREAVYRHSFDMLGEAALTGDDADAYFEAYAAAIDVVGRSGGPAPTDERPGISVKLSALHPRYEYVQRERVLKEMVPRLAALAVAARKANVPLTIDAEEARRLELSLEVFERVFTGDALHGWDGFGLAVQAYQKRAPAVLSRLARLAEREHRRMPLRLVKGAYWDHEIKAAQQAGLSGYPVYTRKAHTDVAFLACARQVLDRRDAFLPQFATHNAHTIAAVLELSEGGGGFEFQRLHGMGQALYERVTEQWGHPCRVYAPVGSHDELLPYLVRRLLENGANTSFVNRIVDARVAPEELAAEPADAARRAGGQPHPGIPLPGDLYGRERRNPAGISLDSPLELAALADGLLTARRTAPEAAAAPGKGEPRPVISPIDGREVGRVVEADAGGALAAMDRAAEAASDWRRTPVADRAAMLGRAADLIEERRAELMDLIIREGGRTVADALSEVREAVDFCRYYGLEARRLFAPIALPGPTGEENRLKLEGRGPFLCLSPWNFPAAIFTGQATAALAAGNPVVAKPAHQTPLTAARLVTLLHEAGIPKDVLQLLPAPSGSVAETLLAHPALAGVAFTGSTETARRIHRTLAGREGPILPLIAETGGQNAMIADSSALTEQLVADVVRSAFTSAGQRCSALRILFLQEETSERVLSMLKGAMTQLRVGNPTRLATDVGPVIDGEAASVLRQHVTRMEKEGRLIEHCTLGPETAKGTFIAPCAFEIDNIDRLHREVFGPILHIVRYRSERLDEVIAAINRTGYGLTLGIHSRIEETAKHIAMHADVGNIYINRDMIGAVVGVQPFGGQGLSGTGPKAGGPHYLTRFVTEKTVTTNTAAVGGNARLLGGEL